MINKERKVWVWSQNRKILVAVVDKSILSFGQKLKILTISDGGSLLMRRLDMTKEDIKRFEVNLKKHYDPIEPVLLT